MWLDYWYPVLIEILGLRKPQMDSHVLPTHGPLLSDEEQVQELKDTILSLHNLQDPTYAIACACVTYLSPDLAELFP